MDLLKNKILSEGYVLSEEILKVDSFLNHQIDYKIFQEIGKEFYRLFGDKKITKILTIEASGIAIATMAAQYFDVPVVFAKKTPSRNLDAEKYTSSVYSFTKQKEYTIMVSKRYISPEDRVLIIDDFLANGRAVLGLLDIINQAGSSAHGVGIVIEKGFQDGGEIIRKQGIHLESLAIVDRFYDDKITFL